MAKRYERVHTITDYWDQPRGGVADFRGSPHVYRSVFDESGDAWSDVCVLSPVDSETFQLALEDREIFLRWRRAFEGGQTSQNTYPALPHDQRRHEAVKTLLAERLVIDPAKAVRAKSEFRAEPDSDTASPDTKKWQVCWSVLKE